MTKKTFGLPVGAPYEEIVNEGEAGAGSFVTEILPLNRIELDPDNPRHLDLDARDPRKLNPDAPDYERKRKALETVEELAGNIRRHGVQQPIKVYPHGKGYRIAFGERRFLAAKLAGEKTIPAWVLPERPPFLRALQFSENELRERLGPAERLKNIRLIVEEIEAMGEGRIDSASALAEAIGLRLSMANNYFDLLMGPEEVRAALDAEVLTNIELAAEIAREPDAEKRKAALSAAAAGAKAKQTRATLRATPKAGSNGRGRPATRVTFGSTKKPMVVRRIVEAVLGDGYERELEIEVDWNDYRSITEVWQRLVKYLEAKDKDET